MLGIVNSKEMKRVCDVLVIELLILVAFGVGEVEPQNVGNHHVVGEDQGWDSSSDIASWTSHKLFRVGDNLWFAYSAAEEIIVELRSKEEYETCNLSNPIKMYTDGLNKVTLVQEGQRYFVSGMLNKCKNGLKLHVEVLPHSVSDGWKDSTMKTPWAGSKNMVLAEAPSIPASACKVQVLSSATTWIVLYLMYELVL